jgi:hypothetical protein
LGKRSTLAFVALIAAVNFPLLGRLGNSSSTLTSFFGLARLSIAFDLSLALWALLTFFGKTADETGSVRRSRLHEE